MNGRVIVSEIVLSWKQGRVMLLTTFIFGTARIGSRSAAALLRNLMALV
jgi:hypothetical protein